MSARALSPRSYNRAIVHSIDQFFDSHFLIHILHPVTSLLSSLLLLCCFQQILFLTESIGRASSANSLQTGPAPVCWRGEELSRTGRESTGPSRWYLSCVPSRRRQRARTGSFAPASEKGRPCQWYGGSIYTHLTELSWLKCPALPSMRSI